MAKVDVWYATRGTKTVVTDVGDAAYTSLNDDGDYIPTLYTTTGYGTAYNDGVYPDEHAQMYIIDDDNFT